MPYDVILERLEETDPALVDEVRGFDEFHALEDEYDDYARAEIIDWTPDAPYLESDQTRRDPALSRSILNLRYNATRGSQLELPRHPELFYGFTGNDPRGSENNPSFDQMRGHIAARAANLTVSMGDNDDFHIAERPWTGQAISYAMKEVHRRLKNNTRVFTVQKEGRPWGRNVAMGPGVWGEAQGRLRAAQREGGDEALAYQSAEWDPNAGWGPDAAARFAGGDHGSAGELHVAGVRGVDSGRRAGADIAPWRHTTGEADLGVQQYGQKRGAGRTQIGPGAVGGGRARTGRADQDWAESEAARSTNRQTLGATMALAARYRHAMASGRPDQGPTPGAGYETRHMPAAHLAPARDVARLYRHVAEDQARRPASGVQDDAGGTLGGAAGLTPAAHPERALRATVAHAAPNGYLTNVESIVAGLREGTAAGRRRIAGSVVADGARHLATAEAVAGARRGAQPGTDYGRVARLAEAPLLRAAAAAGLEVHVYRGAPPARPEQRAALGREAFDAGTWRPSREALPLGMSKAPGEWRSATQGQTTPGDSPERVFGDTAEVPDAFGAAPTGPKSLRSGGWSDSADLSDSIGNYSDTVSIGA